jgi:NAD(P) transhydrogenase subunit alpha
VGETRVALTPDLVATLIGDGWAVTVEPGAGIGSGFTDDHYRDAGATVGTDHAAEVTCRVNAPTLAEVESLAEGSVHLSFLSPLLSLDVVRALVEKKITVVSFDVVPRSTRAQYMDALSSQATVSGYRAVIVAAERGGRFFPLLTTAAGTIRPARVLVMGVGVAGLQAIATAKRLGAKVRAYDVRSAAKEEAQSAGAVFVELGVTADASGGYARELSDDERAAQQAALVAEVASADIVITTAAVPGRRAPILVTREMVGAMAPGSLIVDMAADGGGNCEVTVPGETVIENGVSVIGLSNPPASMGASASFLYAHNVVSLLALYGRHGEVAPDWSDDIVRGATLSSGGLVHHPPTAEALGMTCVPLGEKE